jgi:hypothetical protein
LGKLPSRPWSSTIRNVPATLALLDILEANAHRSLTIAAALLAWSGGRECPEDPAVAAVWQALRAASEEVGWEPGNSAEILLPQLVMLPPEQLARLNAKLDALREEFLEGLLALQRDLQEDL